MHFGVGVIGATGYIGTPYRQEIREAANAKIVALCARRPEPLAAAGREDGAALTTGEWQEVVAHPDVNFVVVATPDARHYEAVMACAARGKHVFCEKPVGLNRREAREMWQAIYRAQLAHFVPYWTRYIPAFQRVRELYRAGTIGEVQALVYRWHNPRPVSMPFTWRDDAEVSAGGSIADVGSHAYDTIRWILGDEARRVVTHAGVLTPAKPDLGTINLSEALAWGQAHVGDVSAAETPKRRGTACDYATMAFEFSSGAVGTIVLSHAPFLRKGLAPELELHGSEASLAVDRLSGEIRLARPEGEVEILDRQPFNGFGNRFAKYVFPAIRAAIAAGETTSAANASSNAHPGLADGYRVQCFTDAALESAATGAWANVESGD